MGEMVNTRKLFDAFLKEHNVKVYRDFDYANMKMRLVMIREPYTVVDTMEVPFTDNEALELLRKMELRLREAEGKTN